MSDYKFSCPSCGQRISATEEYVGYQITCPACQAAIVVPGPSPAPAAPAPSSIATPVAPGAPPPPAPPGKTRLGVSALQAPSPAHAAPSGSMLADVGANALRAHLAKKEKKDYTGIIAGSVVAVILGAGAFLGRGWIADKYHSMTGSSEQAVAAPATNEPPPPPPPPPELTASDVWQKVTDAYKSAQTLTMTGTFTSLIDMSKINSRLIGLQTTEGDLTLKFSRPRNFRIDLSLAVAGSNVINGWSAGSGNYIQANNTRVPEPTPEAVMDRFNQGYAVGAGDIARLYVDDPLGTLATAPADWTKTNDDTLNGQACYVLAGTIQLQDVKVWVNKKTFLIAQTQVQLSGKTNEYNFDDNKIRERLMAANGGRTVYSTQIKAVKNLALEKGTVTESYSQIQTNATLTLADFEPPKPVVAVAATTPGQGGPGGQPGAGGDNGGGQGGPGGGGGRGGGGMGGGPGGGGGRGGGGRGR